MTRECDAFTYGSLLRSLASAGLWPRKKPEKLTWSVERLGTTIRDLVLGMPANPFGHSLCDITNFAPYVKKVMAELESPALDSHLAHMKRQRRKLAKNTLTGRQVEDHDCCSSSGDATSNGSFSENGSDISI